MDSFLSLGEYLKREKELESLNCGEVPESFRNSDIDASTLWTSQSKHIALSAADSLQKLETNKKEMDLYMNKTGTEIQRPKMIVCFQNDAYQVVKEFCIDLGMHHSNKDVQEHVEEQNSKLYKSFDCSESLYVLEHPNIDADKKNYDKIGGGESEKVMDKSSKDNVTAKDVLQQEELDDNRTLIASSDFLFNDEKWKIAANGDTQDLPGKKTNSMASSINYFAGKSDGGETSANVLSDGCTSEILSVESCVEVDATSLSQEKQDEGTIETHQPGLISIQSVYGQDSTNSAILSRHLHSQCSQAESILCGEGCLSADRINCAGQTLYSGSISLRSDSSTTSTRSFAFPILQSEWNSSPVRMARADRKHCRRQRGWRIKPTHANLEPREGLANNACNLSTSAKIIF